MRAMTRAYLADHPMLTAGILGIRWAGWLIVGHPVAVTAAIVGLGFRLPALAVVAAALALDGLVMLRGGRFAGSGGPSRAIWIWAAGTRFRRRWPMAFVEAYVQPPFDRAAVFPGNYYSAPDGLRPVLTAPTLTFFPTGVTDTTVSWSVRPWSAQAFGDVRGQVARIAAADDRVVRAELTGRLPSRRRRWDLTVTFGRAQAQVDPAGPPPGSDLGLAPDVSGNGSGGRYPTRRGGPGRPAVNGSPSVAAPGRPGPGGPPPTIDVPAGPVDSIFGSIKRDAGRSPQPPGVADPPPDDPGGGPT
ncbi:MAG: hypothetical protein AAF547_08750 [Actinomycetota bacterium]